MTKTKGRIRKYIYIILVILIIGLAGYYWIATRADRQKTDVENLTITTVQTGNLQKLVYADGQVKAKDSRTVYSEFSGIVTEINVEQDQEIVEEDELIVIETTNAFGNTKEEIIEAPISGTITQIKVELNQPVLINQTPLFEIIDLNNLRIESYVSEGDIASLNIDQKVQAEFPALEDIFVDGSVSFIAKAPDEIQSTSPQYKVITTLNELPEDLKVGMTSNIEIITEEKSGILTLDEVYIFEKDDQDYVHKITDPSEDNFTYEDVEITIGFIGENAVEIISGISTGDKLLLPNEEIENSIFNGGLFGGGSE